MRPSATARRYARAAFDVATSAQAVDEWLGDLEAAASGLSGRDATLFFRDPKVTGEEKLQTVDRLFPNIRPDVMNLLRILVNRERVHLLPAILREFQSLNREACGILEAEVTVARPFDESERQVIARRLAETEGKQVEVEMKVNPAILGGIVVRIGDRLIDASVSGRLERLRQEMAV